MSSGKLKLITFDLDNTLWDVDSVIIKAEKVMVDWMRAHTPDVLDHYNSETLPNIRKTVVQRHPENTNDLSFMRTEVLYEVMRLAGYAEPQARIFANDAFALFFEHRNKVVFFPGALDLLEKLASQYTLYALTNGNADIDRVGLSKFFEGAYCSADVNASKPDPTMFHVAMNAVGVAANDTVHIGDNPIDDVHGAARAGMHTIWVNFDHKTEHPERTDDHPELEKPTHTVGSLDEIHQAIDHIEVNRPK